MVYCCKSLLIPQYVVNWKNINSAFQIENMQNIVIILLVLAVNFSVHK